jgi:hypothetical protein
MTLAVPVEMQGFPAHVALGSAHPAAIRADKIEVAIYWNTGVSDAELDYSFGRRARAAPGACDRARRVAVV